MVNGQEVLYAMVSAWVVIRRLPPLCPWLDEEASGSIVILFLDVPPAELAFQDERGCDEASSKSRGPADEAEGRALVWRGACAAEE